MNTTHTSIYLTIFAIVIAMAIPAAGIADGYE